MAKRKAKEESQLLPWGETCGEMERRKREVCAKCAYSHWLSGVSGAICGYLLDTGRMRPCRPQDCQKEGVYAPRKKGRHRSAPPGCGGTEEWADE